LLQFPGTNCLRKKGGCKEAEIRAGNFWDKSKKNCDTRGGSETESEDRFDVWLLAGTSSKRTARENNQKYLLGLSLASKLGQGEAKTQK